MFWITLIAFYLLHNKIQTDEKEIITLVNLVVFRSGKSI